jgi:hypothetical protein
VTGFSTAGSSLPPGSIVRRAGHMHLHCLGGIVELA